VVYIGTLEHYQGVDLLVNSLPLVLKTNSQVKYVIVGGWPEQIKDFKNLAESLGVAESVIFTGQRETNEMPDFLALADVLVSPRIKGTNTPLKIYDYLKSGKPIVATDLLTHTQILNQNIAVLTEPNPEKFAEGIISVLENSELSARISEEARKVADSKYSEREYLIKIKKIYESKI
jgi:glycosyltransferase involved in cell wall biosynthesis